VTELLHFTRGLKSRVTPLTLANHRRRIIGGESSASRVGAIGTPTQLSAKCNETQLSVKREDEDPRALAQQARWRKPPVSYGPWTHLLAIRDL